MATPYGPRDWEQLQHHHELVHPPEPLFAWRLGQTQSRGYGNRRLAETSQPRRSRPPRTMRNLLRRGEDEYGQGRFNPALLYPQMSPYDEQLDVVSAPDVLEHPWRTVSQPTTPSYMKNEFETTVPHSAMPRFPTYPPTSRRQPRFHSASGVTDAAFDDEHDFHLFVEATAGLGNIPPFRNDRSSSDSSTQRYKHEGTPIDHHPVPDTPVSPLEETPIAAWAMQQLPQMPQSIVRPQRQPLDTSASGLDLWLQPPSATRRDECASTPDVSPIEDELPDYTASQEQAQAAQRAGATRRAQELQRRWRERGRRGAMDDSVY